MRLATSPRRPCSCCASGRPSQCRGPRRSECVLHLFDNREYSYLGLIRFRSIHRPVSESSCLTMTGKVVTRAFDRQRDAVVLVSRYPVLGGRPVRHRIPPSMGRAAGSRRWARLGLGLPMDCRGGACFASPWSAERQGTAGAPAEGEAAGRPRGGRMSTRSCGPPERSRRRGGGGRSRAEGSRGMGAQGSCSGRLVGAGDE
jgi:hypothetical protein